MTIADKIRAMNDEELADILSVASESGIRACEKKLGRKTQPLSSEEDRSRLRQEYLTCLRIEAETPEVKP